MLLSERARIEIFIPDLPDPSYIKLLRRLQTEFSYTFGGCTVLSASGSFMSAAGVILPDKLNILFTDVPLDAHRDRLVIGQYTEWLRIAAQDALRREELILVSVYSVYHDE